MPERGGATTQDGIHYQNSVAVLALLDMLDMDPAPEHRRVTDVRVEAPEHVDDIVIRHADATAVYQSVKLELPTGKPWDNLWEHLGKQRFSEGFRDHDRLEVVVANSNQTFEDCVEMTDRVQAENLGEWISRLTKRQLAVLDSITKQIGSREAAWTIFQRVEFLHWSPSHVEAEYNRRRLAAGGSTELPRVLRDVVSGGAKHRAHYRAGPLRRRLTQDHGLHLDYPPMWGLATYQETIKREAIISIPGTDRGGPVEDLFVWPRAHDFQADGLRDFEDEDPSYWAEPIRNRVDLRSFPQQELDRVIVVAGPGYGKSALLTALSSELAPGPYVPVEIPLALLAKSDLNVLPFVDSHLSDEYGLAADWRRLAEQGLLVLLYDGLDEIPGAERTRVLRRIARFSSLFPRSPWLLTARDPAVVSGLPDARQVELTPLSDEDIAAFVTVIAKQLNRPDASRFVNRLKQYPDLNRLARIPLFLSMLLATTDTQELAPMTRSDLIEGYLATLLKPAEHKIVSDDLPAPALRAIAQDIAYRKIEAQEIGVSEAEVRAVIAEHTHNPEGADRAFQLLRSNGILRPQGPSRFRFPYPIVQEYLAACYLVEHEADSLSTRIDQAVSRPWAQVMQFAIERLPNPERIIQEVLDRDDDAFMTGLRLVGRCVANGATVSGSTHRDIGDRLVAAWKTVPTRARDAIGRLLCDGFTGDNLDALREAVHLPWLQHAGAGDIVTKINDAELTLSVLSALIRGSQKFKVYWPLRQAIEQIQVRAFDLARDLILEVDDPDARDARASVLVNFPTHPDLALDALELARNPEIPLNGRLLAYALPPGVLGPDGAELLHSTLLGHGTGSTFAANRLLSRLPDPQRYLEEVLHSDEFTEAGKLALVRTVGEVFPDADVRVDFIDRLGGGLSEAAGELRATLDVMAAAAGDETAFARLVSNIETNPADCARSTISLLGNFRSQSLAEEAADRAQARFTSPDDVVHMGNAAVIGMLYILEMSFGFGGGPLYPAQPHPGIERWAALVEDWSSTVGLTDLQRLEALTSASRLGAEDARRQLECMVEGISDPNAPKWNDGGSLGATLAHAIREIRRRTPLLDRDLLMRFIRADQINAATAGISALTAHGDRDALERLLAAHREKTLAWSAKDKLANSIELLSLKLGIAVRQVDHRYELQNSAGDA